MSIFIGFDPREAAAFAVARNSVRRNIGRHVPVYGLVLKHMEDLGLYYRPTRRRINSDGHVEMIDDLSIRSDYDGRISTEHAIARFLVPHVARFGWALFMDGDMLVRASMASLFSDLDPRFAAYCVKHNHVPSGPTKMDGQEQTVYSRKNWSSFVLFNCDHASNQKLTIEEINRLPGRDLHRFCWLDDTEIGELAPEWNFLVGHTNIEIEPKVVHWTDGPPNMPGYENTAYAEEWRAELRIWARSIGGFGSRPPILTEASRAEFKKQFIDPVVGA